MRATEGIHLRSTLGVAAICLAVLLPASDAGATATIGRIAGPGFGTVNACTGANYLYVQTIPPPGTSYVVPPGNGLVTSWSHQALSTATTSKTLGLIVLRKIANPSTYLQVGHDGPRPIVPGTLNTFAVDIPVQPGDIIGVDAGNATAGQPNGCFINIPSAGFDFDYHPGSLADGTSDSFFASNTAVVNVAAVVEPTNRITVGKVKKNKKLGTATLTVTVPGPGEVSVSGSGVSTFSARSSTVVTAAGEVGLLIKAKGKKRKKLAKKGKVKLNVTVGFIPTGGSLRNEETKVALRKKR